MQLECPIVVNEERSVRRDPEPLIVVNALPPCEQKPHLRRHSLWQQALKRAFDISFVVMFGILFWWVFVSVAISIKLSGPGPLVFGHVRVGRDGKRFRCYKFRSMVNNASEVLERLLGSDHAARMEWETNFKLKNDPRITRVGNFIRRTSLDELPQLWNILCGDMSVVGPRPVVRQEIAQYYGQGRRHYISVRPGLTGPWQVSGRSNTSYEERVAMDCEYAENWSLWGDIVIVWKTIASVLTGHGAY